MATRQPSGVEREFALPAFRSLYALTVCVALLVAADVLCWWLGYESLRNPGGVNLSLIAAVLGGARIVYGALAALLEREVGADLALAIAMIAAIVLQEYWVAAEVVLIAMVGECLEAITFSRTHRELGKILELRPRVVRVRRGEQVVELPIDQVRVADLVIVRPGDRVPVDGTVVSGRTSIDQSTLTGESLPIDKGEGDAVYAGTINQFGALEVRADKVGDETTLGQVLQLVAQARRNKAHVERLADRLARYFLPFVLGLAAVTFVVTNYSGLQLGVAGRSGPWVWMPTLAVLVVACPCSLILATPAAMMAALAWLARRGVLTTGGAAIERLATVTRFAFDKTGTLTEGRLELGDCVPLGDGDESQLLAWAAAAEQSSEHLIARVLVRTARERSIPLPEIAAFQALPGAGVVARLAILPAQGAGTGRLLVGNRRLMQEHGLIVSPEVDAVLTRLEQAAQTPLLISCDERIVGVIGVRDTIRPEAGHVIAALRELGIDQIALLTGDRQAAAEQVARATGIDLFAAELRPDEKANWLADWCEEDPEHRHGPDGGPAHPPEAPSSAPRRPIRVAMVGDGVNDAPALAIADVGLALGGVGSDLAAEAGDLILMGDPLTPLPGLVRLSRETVRVIRQNIVLFAFVYNLTGIALTAWIMPTWSPAWMTRSPIAAAILHQAGSLLVLLNGMRLLWFERWQGSRLGRLESALAGACGRLVDGLRPLGTMAGGLWRVRRRLGYAALGLVFAGYLTQGVVFVQPDEVGLVRRFGRYQAVLEPGPHLRLPPPWETVIREKPYRVRTIELGLRRTRDPAGQPLAAIEWNTPHDPALRQRQEDEALMLTGDQSLVELAASVHYRRADVRAWHFHSREPERMLQTLSETVVREVLASFPLLTGVAAEGQGAGDAAAAGGAAQAAAEILTGGRGAAEEAIRRRLQSRADALALGVEILPRGVCLLDVHPPLAVVPAFRDVSSAFKEKERMRNEAQGYYRERLIKAAGQEAWSRLSREGAEVDDALWAGIESQLAGEAAAELNAARGAAEQRVGWAAGDAQRFTLTEAAQAAAPERAHWRLWLQTLAETLPGKKKLILDDRAAGRRHLLLDSSGGGASRLVPVVSPEQNEEP